MRSLIILVGTLLFASVGCKKKVKEAEAPSPAAPEAAPAAASAPAPPAQPGAPVVETLPGASAVRAALKKKDWAGAVSGVIALKGIASRPGGDWGEYRQLNAEVSAALAKAAPSDPAAAQAQGTYRLLTGSGR